MEDKDPNNLPPYPTLEALLKQYATPLELGKDLDYAMLVLVIHLYYEPARASEIARSYESLYELRNLIQSQTKD